LYYSRAAESGNHDLEVFMMLDFGAGFVGFAGFPLVIGENAYISRTMMMMRMSILFKKG
jgi:hypothetical protein